MYLAVKDVKTIDDYKLILTFEDGSVRIFDMKPLLRKLFKTVKVSFDSIEWANGIDVDPETLYEDGVPYCNE